MRRNLILLIALFALCGMTKTHASQEVVRNFQWEQAADYIASAVINPAEIIFPRDGKLRFDDSLTRPVSLPFITEEFDHGIFTCTFDLPDSLPNANDWFLYSGGMSCLADISIDGHSLGRFTNNLMPAKIHIPEAIITSGKKLKVTIQLRQVKSVSDGFPVLPLVFSEKSYLGIIRPLFLVRHKTESVILTETATIPKNQNYEGRISFRLSLPRPEKEYGVNLKILGSDGKTLFKKAWIVSGETRQISAKVLLNEEQLWSPEHPVFARVQVTVLSGRKTIALLKQKTAFRKLSLQNGKLYLNTTPLQVRGIVLHLNPQRYVGQNRQQILRRDLAEIKSSGFNAIRTLHYFPDEFLLHQADSLGLLVFAELPIWRYPATFFLEDILLENTKTAVKEAVKIGRKHPSLAALGLGQELPIYQGSVQKFMLILRQLLGVNNEFLTYLSPIPGHPLSVDRLCDFYIWDTYHSLSTDLIKHAEHLTEMKLAGRLGLTADPALYRPNLSGTDFKRLKYLQKEWNTIRDLSKAQGGFFESWQDWKMNLPIHLTVFSPEPEIMPTGLLIYDHVPRPLKENFHSVFTQDGNAILTGNKSNKKRSNFFSITLFLSTIFFFFIYRKQPRMRENVRRAIRHSYGFFVDLRERRIIPLINSFWVGSFSAIIFAVYNGSFLYYYNRSFLLQEIAGLFLKPMNFYESFLRLNTNPFYITGLLFLLFLIFPVFLSITLQIIGMLSGRKIRFRQVIAIGWWSGIPTLFMLPFAFVLYPLLGKYLSISFFFLVLAFFLLWAYFRIVNGIRVLFIVPFSKVFLLTLLSCFVPLLILFAVFNPMSGWTDYLRLILNSVALF